MRLVGLREGDGERLVGLLVAGVQLAQKVPRGGVEDLELGQDGKVVLRNFVPNLLRVLLVVGTDGHQASVQLIEITFLLRELAHLLHAERSPVSAIEIDHHPPAPLRRQRKRLALRIHQGKIRRPTSRPHFAAARTSIRIPWSR